MRPALLVMQGALYKQGANFIVHVLVMQGAAVFLIIQGTLSARYSQGATCIFGNA